VVTEEWWGELSLVSTRWQRNGRRERNSCPGGQWVKTMAGGGWCWPRL
jgi:hypothetical protein